MWYEIFKFELKYRVKRPETYVFFAFLFLFSIVGVDFIFQGVEIGLILQTHEARPTYNGRKHCSGHKHKWWPPTSSSTSA